MLQVCLNGARSPREHFHLPVRPEELAKAAADSVAAGATDVHLHPKSADGTDTLDPHSVSAALRAVRAAAPGVSVGVTTGAWTAPDTASRVRAIKAWTLLPDHASVNWHEPGADEVAAALLERGVGVEAGIFSGTDGDHHFKLSPHRGRVLRVLAEVTDPSAGGAAGTAEALLDRLHPASAPILLHGESAGAWPVLRVAARRGFATRIGLEDTLVLPNGQIATDNAELVAAAVVVLAAESR
ncbi:3-keto-5-aminohexanoate cleavage protein [Saccharopolyspora mangrovi]|uniref:3-keto-5-aminohexanoate cleavage protein n=1 Tax=Saccharopolyspora mangrovi TaxID=3082379 RepID=A0ABU6AH40_9PSEU|nr:3-keto-5-aminohexanoate cleavage protein [Saccharopolyspora sp. S2-29]MEB3370864.1 3-keto-5-aminohexanoate cleavage protein [Saccharopolyspora sp. S2-29]